MKDSEIIATLKSLLPVCAVLKRAVIKKPDEETLIENGVERVIQIHFSIKGFGAETLRLEQEIKQGIDSTEAYKLITDFTWCAFKVCRDRMMINYFDREKKTTVEH